MALMLKMPVRTVRVSSYTVTDWSAGCNVIIVKAATKRPMPLRVLRWVRYRSYNLILFVRFRRQFLPP